MSAVFAKSHHQQNVEAFMLRAKQEVPLIPTVPYPDVRVLRAKLILEEALETIAALGVNVSVCTSDDSGRRTPWTNITFDDTELHFEPLPRESCNLPEVVDGCCDLRVVTTGTLSACGVPDEYVQGLVDRNNLFKFAPGHSWRADGKLIKPPGHKAPGISRFLSLLTAFTYHESGVADDGNPYLQSASGSPEKTHPQTSQADASVNSEPGQPCEPGPHDSVGRYKTPC